MQDLWERVYIVTIGRLSARDDYELPALVKRAARIADLAEEEVRRRQAGDTATPVAVAFGKEAVEAWAMGYTDDTGTFVVEHCDAFEGNNDAADMLHDYSPAGLWYWEGYLKTLEHHAGDFDVEAVGKFYPTTAAMAQAPFCVSGASPFLTFCGAELVDRCPLCSRPVMSVPPDARPSNAVGSEHQDCTFPNRGARWVV